MLKLFKRLPFINGGDIHVESETNREVRLLTGENSQTTQCEYYFRNDGKLFVRTRTRTNVSSAWGTWSSWSMISDVDNLPANKVSKTGDTMTGLLRINDSSVSVVESRIDQSVNPTGSLYGYGYYFHDKNGPGSTDNQVGYLRAHTKANTIGLQLEAKRMVNGASKYNTLNMTVDNNGTPVTELNKAAWTTALGLDVISTDTIANIITVNSDNATISSARYRQYGKVAQVQIDWKNVNAISVPASGNISNVQIGTLVSGKRPSTYSNGTSAGDSAGQAWYNINLSGVISLGACEGTGAARTIAAGTTFNFYSTFILP